MLLSGQMKTNLGYLYPAKTTVTELEIDKDVACPEHRDDYWPMFCMAA